MALTDIETIKKIIQAGEVFIPTIFDERIELILFERAQLNHKNIVENSESVKIIRTNVPTQNSVTLVLVDQNPINLDSTKIVRDTVVVADDAVLSTVYIENVDYIVDYINGSIERTTLGSSITSGDAVYAWFVPYITLTDGGDYNFHYGEGQLNRRAGTTIPNKATVFIDYAHSEGLPSDELITETIKDMEAFIEPKLKAPFTLDSAERGLKAAATNYTMYGICLAMGFRELNVAGKDISDSLAKRWMDLSKMYISTAAQLFAKYLKVASIQWGGMVQNRYVRTGHKTMISPSVQRTTRRH
ncbi:MAG: hypothetical protein GY845_09410 [Planctomycetes bacterium]|nr:hypothetical protein [Planctomycetota bacterium]